MNELLYEYYSAVEQKRIDWLWYPYIPYGKITVIQGDPGEGKSTLAINIAALVTRGMNMPDGFKTEHPQTVIYQCAEDSIADTIKPRLLAAGADCNKVAYIIDEKGDLNLKDTRIEETLDETGASMLIIDPLQAFMVQDGDMQNASRMRGVLRRLSVIAEKYNCAVILIGHMTKRKSDKNLYRGLGSIDIAAIARSILLIDRDREDPSTRYMFHLKSNLAPEGCAIGFYFDEEKGFQWTGPCETTLESLEYYEETESPNKRTLAQELIKERLLKGDERSKEIYRVLEAKGIGHRTAELAKKDLGAKAYRKRDVWYWSLNNENSEVMSDE